MGGTTKKEEQTVVNARKRMCSCSANRKGDK